jgi:hypothetical protein
METFSVPLDDRRLTMRRPKFGISSKAGMVAPSEKKVTHGLCCESNAKTWGEVHDRGATDLKSLQILVLLRRRATENHAGEVGPTQQSGTGAGFCSRQFQQQSLMLLASCVATWRKCTSC